MNKYLIGSEDSEEIGGLYLQIRYVVQKEKKLSSMQWSKYPFSFMSVDKNCLCTLLCSDHKRPFI